MQVMWLSIIIPSYNSTRWFAAALQSAAAEAEPGIELVIVDGSGGDEAVRIAETFADKLDLRIYRRPDLQTWIAKTNFGVAEARAPHLCMLHTDDLWLPGRAAAVRDWLADQPEAVMHMHPAWIIDEAGRRRGIWRSPLPSGKDPIPRETLLERLLVQNFIAVPTPVIRRDAFIRVGGLDDRLWYTADWDLYLKLAGTGDFYYHPDPLACFRIHRDSQTVSGSRSLADFREQMQVVLDRHIGSAPAASRAATLRAANISIAVNTALAAVNGGSLREIIRSVLAVLRLIPGGASKYLRYSRIIERAYPRLRARLSSGF